MPGWILRQAMHCPREPAPPPAGQGFASLVLRLWARLSHRWAA
jgi:hypothetical protein